MNPGRFSILGRNDFGPAAAFRVSSDGRVKSYPHLGAFESTKIFGSGQDVLATTRHIDLWRRDLEMLAKSGITELRYPVPWHRIESHLGHWDWQWMDGPMQLMRDLGLRPILDPLHHVSFPDWLVDGFLNADFPDLYKRFVRQVAERYDWATRYTVFNEPLPTVLLCSHMGIWYPYARSDRAFVSMAINAGKAICLAAAELRKLNAGIELIHIDSCEHHRALDDRSHDAVVHANHRRFLFHDLILGKIDREHPLFEYLTSNGFADEQQHWFRDHSAPFDVLGLDYYPHSEIDWGWSTEEMRPVIRFPCSRALGFAEVASHYVQRYRCPVLLTETNVGGSVRDRVTWLRCMEQQSEKLADQADFRGFCWFPSIDATDWSSLCTQARLDLSPMGVWSLDAQRTERQESELSRWYVRLAQRKATWRDLPLYPFEPPLDRDLLGFLHLIQEATATDLSLASPE